MRPKEGSVARCPGRDTGAARRSVYEAQSRARVRRRWPDGVLASVSQTTVYDTY